MSTADFLSWSDDIEWTLWRLKWPVALTMALLALVLTQGG